MRYTLFYTNYHGKKRFDDSWLPIKEQIHFKTLKEAQRGAGLSCYYGKRRQSLHL